MITSEFNTLMIARLICIGLLLCPVLVAQTSENNPRLKAALKIYPAADADKDGVLTLAEAMAYKVKRTGQTDQEHAQATPAPVGGERQVYKQVGDTRLSLYVYKPAGHKADAKTPAIVFFHGGAWKAGNPSQFERQCKYFASRGMVAVTAQYRLTSQNQVKVEDCIEDAKSAMRWVRGHAAELGVDPDRIASGGGSAGGHLGACVSVIDEFDAKTDDLNVSAKPNVMVLFNPALALARDPRMSEIYLARIKADMDAKNLRGPREKVSPLTYASSKQAPCIMFFGTDDSLLEGAELYRTNSVKAGNSCRIVTYVDQGHGFFNLGKYYDLTLAEADKFLVSLGWLPAK